MNRLTIFGAAAAAASLSAAGCTNAPDGATDNDKTIDGKARITIGIKADTPSRVLLSDVSGTVGSFENAIKGFDAYVFDWNSGFLESSGKSTTGDPIVLQGVSTSTSKRIVVIANGGGITTIPEISHYDRIGEAYVALAEQSFTASDIASATRGLLMTGENSSGMTVYEGNDERNSIEIAVRRVVSKVQLGTVSFDDNITLADLLKFNVTGASIQKALGSVTISPSESVAIAPYVASGSSYAGGYTGGYTTALPNGDASVSTVQSAAMLTSGLDIRANTAALLDEMALTVKIAGEEIEGSIVDNLDALVAALIDPEVEVTGLEETLGQAKARVGAGNFTASRLTNTVNALWYVLPNDGSTGNPTLATLRGTHDGADYYYPIEINTPKTNPSGEGASTGAGLYLKRNTVYTINVTFHDLIGTSDPDTAGKMANITVTVAPEPWAGPVVQNTVW